MRLDRLAQAADLVYPDRAAETEITGIVSDSRQVRSGSLFVALTGTKADGHDFVSDAVRRGAACVLTLTGRELTVPATVVRLETDDTRLAIARLADAYFSFPSRKMKYIAVTGTNGKTSVAYILRSILAAAGYRCGLIGTVACESAGRVLRNVPANELAHMTTPDPEELYRILSEMAADGDEYVVMEASSHALALSKLAPLHFDAVIFTNLTPEHLDFHGDMEQYYAAKARILSMTDLLVVNLETPVAGRLLTDARSRKVTCGTDATGADYQAVGIEDQGLAGVSYLLRGHRASIRLFCPVPGRFTVMNTMQAAATAYELGVPVRTIRDALGTFCGIAGRMEKVSGEGLSDLTVFIDFAHTPAALENLLLSAHGLRAIGQRIVLLFGCGGDRDRKKRKMMAQIASKMADYVIITSDNSRSEEPREIINEILSGMDPDCPCEVVEDRREAILLAVTRARPGDVLLLAGKGHETYEIDRRGSHPFDEREIVKEAGLLRLTMTDAGGPPEKRQKAGGAT